ncbi:DMT family transporter [Brevibacterium sediminis]|uniref:QacE family quaternary ammonium compound efflux SMR transporter n=1 Tax=Brevibacterium sediminis TaxID=1857024 RepID=A0ABQ1MSA4_9MICO|nr:multidrug efflux SMR transporter [Brevibacterium sediminis]GGC44104.1 QacE family quaternary ammonium compound efflux SMR transporter [Brevibacterium sediminis]
MNAPAPAADTVEPAKNGRAWIALLVAGGFEIGYALSVNGSGGFTDPIWSSLAVVFFLLTMFFLSVALKHVDVGIGYAVWTGIGAVGAAVFGPLFFDEHLTWTTAIWLAVIIAGVVWLKIADSTKPGVDEQATR